MAVPAWVTEVGIAAQVVIAVVAIWGDRLRARLSKPRLQLTLHDPIDDSELREIPDIGIVTVRYCRLEVRNRTRFLVANEVQVFITNIDIREPSGQVQKQFTGAIPLEWQYQELYHNTRNIGQATIAVANLFFLYSDFTQLTLMAQPVPPNIGGRRTGSQNFWITAIARGLNAESPLLRIEIQWDGQMAGHLAIRAVH